MRVLVLLFLFAVPSYAQTWKAIVLEKARDGFDMRVVVEYSNGTERNAKAYKFDGSGDISAQLQAQIDAQLTRFAKIDTAIAAVTTGTKEPSPAPSPTPAPTPDESARATFFANYENLKRLHEAVSHKVLLPTDKEVTDLELLVKSQYKAGYFD